MPKNFQTASGQLVRGGGEKERREQRVFLTTVFIAIVVLAVAVVTSRSQTTLRPQRIARHLSE